MMLDEITHMLEAPLARHLTAALALNDDLARHPEISNQEIHSSAKIVALLREQGLAVEYPFAGEPTGFKATIPGGRGAGARIALLVEYDALPGVGHGCGHSASGAISVLSGLALNELRQQFAGQVDMVGTPDEEVGAGKVRMANLGAFEGYDAAIMMHMFSLNASFTPFLALDSFRYEFTGKPAHAAAMPWEGRNALNAVQLLFHASDMMRQHVKDDIRIHGVVREGGLAPNIVPEFASAEFFVRGKQRAELNPIVEWLHDCARAAALATRTQVEVIPTSPPLNNLTKNLAGDDLLKRLFTRYHLPLSDESELPLGSSDIGELDKFCPTFHPMLRVKPDLALHTQEFAAEMLTEHGHTAIHNGARIVAGFALALLTDAALLAQVKGEYEAQRK